ncbi:DNA gyrase inhibitor YacG [Ramlibacter sp. H39-3-26]|jgi:endogenous inhibitor of DNA gyrase (YacG/DUF329 family)|uniref:DNA gyrase inhibitor YacG n=1 Tax=Curvibacter soli TaxID=3031331 RepID=UPI0023DC3F05|nr:DNA gyrase inhibitor YacG [Ramlibacter sp. H39-3-26]MDF1485470.1 DNA gyrase inhibitor YacG [Ramlibacter sp. H39-3-26]
MTSSGQDPQAKIVTCPTCRGPAVFTVTNAHRPFCSQRCRFTDLGAWANETFRMPSEAPPVDETYGDPRLQH